MAGPDVIWFRETLSPIILIDAQQLLANARTMLVIGTSALVQPASLLPHVAQAAGARIIEFNLEPTALTPYVDESIWEPTTQTLPAWWNKALESVEG